MGTSFWQSGRRSGVALLSAVALPCSALFAQAPATGNSYLEFGTVVAIQTREVQVRVNDPAVGHAVQRSFVLSRDTRADLVHAGETVEVIYSYGPGGELLLDRLIALRGEIPRIGPAPVTAAPATQSAVSPAPVSPAPVRQAQPRAIASSGEVSRAPAAPSRPTAHASTGKRSRTSASRSSQPQAAAAATPSRPSASHPASVANPVSLGNPAQARVPALSQVPLGGSLRVVDPVAPRATTVVQQVPGELCNRTQSWASQPTTLAVLDFRYPTEREESRDISQVGGGSGTVLADQVYNQLADDPRLALSRGDREKVFRMDFAGAARLGRQLGVDAVLLGTFVPVDQPNPDPDFPQPTQAYTLRAGIVETCTGELLYKLESGIQITTKEAANPKANLQAFAAPLAGLLAPVLQDGPPAGMTGDAGMVTEVHGSDVTLRIRSGASLRAGDQVGVHAFRLAKIPSTNTLHVFRNELIGRVTISRVSGQYAYGTFAGEPAPLPGDLADLITE